MGGGGAGRNSARRKTLDMVRNKTIKIITSFLETPKHNNNNCNCILYFLKSTFLNDIIIYI